MKNNEESIILDDTLVARLEGNQILVTRFNNVYYFDYKNQMEPPDMIGALEEFKGKRVCLMSSDVVDVFNRKIKIKNLEKHNLVRISNKVITEYLHYLVGIADKENTGVLIQTQFDTNNPSLLITAGLLDDVQVILLELHYERNERRY